jgi:predicted phage terminase large subunit-like protein
VTQPIPRERLERYAAALQEKKRRDLRKEFGRSGGLIKFVEYFWPVLEPGTPFVHGWTMDAICEHLEAVSDGRINKLLINVPPGFSKSMLVMVFWPLWEWAALKRAHERYATFAYAAHLTERDNRRMLQLIRSPRFKEMFPEAFALMKQGEELISNDAMGWKLASSVGGVGTGERGSRILIDDPHNVAEGESDAVRTSTVNWFRESISDRLNNMETGVIIIIMQRVHERDVSGTILELGMDYCHLCIPMEYDPARHCGTVIGWEDPRVEFGELAWHERFPAHVVANIKIEKGPYAYSGQYQQSPSPRGGGIIKRDWWQIWDSPDSRFPPLSLILASADTAYTEKEENDPTGFTIWGVWSDNGQPKLMLLNCWEKRLQLHGPDVPRLPDEKTPEWEKRAMKHWGLCEWIAHSCRKFKADIVLIENKASGISVAQELHRLHASEGWQIHMNNPEGDKVARAYAVQSLFTQGLIYAPDRDWAELAITRCEQFPKGLRDVGDSVTQALKWLREQGILIRKEERVAMEIERARFRPQTEPLYDA